MSHNYLKKMEPGHQVEAYARRTIEQPVVVKRTGLSPKDVSTTYETIFDWAFDAIFKEIWGYIEAYTPRDTGHLLNTLQDSFHKSKVGAYGSQMWFDLGTRVKYAGYVDAMPTDKGGVTWTWRRGRNKGKTFQPHVRHSGVKGGRSGMLNDPKAQGGFWGKLEVILKKRVEVWVMESIRKHAPKGTVKAFMDNTKVVEL